MTTPSFENFYDIMWYVDSKGRKATYIRTNIPFQVVNGKVELGEIPDSIYKIRINNMTEISLNGLIKSATTFKCNYNTGTLYFDNSQEGNFFNISFSAKGKIKYYSKNMMVEDSHNVFANDNVEDVLYETNQRINNLITSNPQPSEVQDARANGANGITYDNLKARLDDESAEIKNARTDIIGGVTYDTIKERLDKHSQDINDNKNNIGDMTQIDETDLVTATDNIAIRVITKNDGITDDAIAINQAITNAPLCSHVLIPKDAYIKSSIIINKTLNFTLYGTITVDGCNGIEIGTIDSPAHDSTVNIGSIYKKQSYDYQNSGIKFVNSILSTVNFKEIQGFENGLDFSPQYDNTNDVKIGGTAENRIKGGTIQGCINGVRIRYSGTGTEFVNTSNRGWAEGNTIEASIFGCDKGIYIETNALATYTNLLGVIDCAQDHTGLNSNINYDIYSDIEKGIFANLYFLNDYKVYLKNGSTDKLTFLPFSDVLNAIPKNISLNPMFKGNLTNWFTNSYTVTKITDGAIKLVPNGSDQYIQQTLPNYIYNNKYLTFKTKIRQDGGLIANALTRLNLFYNNASGLQNILSREFNITNADGEYTTITWTVKIPSDIVGVPFIRLFHPNQTDTLIIKSVEYWFGIRADASELVDENIVPSARIYRSTNQTFTGMTINTINFDSINHDTYEMFDLAHPTRLTCKKAGVYIITGNVTFQADSIGMRTIGININGTVTIASHQVNAGTNDTELAVATTYMLNEGDFIELAIYTTTSNTVTILAKNNWSPVLTATKIA